MHRANQCMPTDPHGFIRLGEAHTIAFDGRPRTKRVCWVMPDHDTEMFRLALRIQNISDSHLRRLEAIVGERRRAEENGRDDQASHHRRLPDESSTHANPSCLTLAMALRLSVVKLADLTKRTIDPGNFAQAHSSRSLMLSPKLAMRCDDLVEGCIDRQSKRSIAPRRGLRRASPTTRISPSRLALGFRRLGRVCGCFLFRHLSSPACTGSESRCGFLSTT